MHMRESAVPPGHARKFRRPWTGPHIVMARSSPWNYQLSLNKVAVVHANQLKEAFGREGVEDVSVESAKV